MKLSGGWKNGLAEKVEGERLSEGMGWDSIVLAQACPRESGRVQRALLGSGTLVLMWEAS
jgi:hypothetical protein